MDAHAEAHRSGDRRARGVCPGCLRRRRRAEIHLALASADRGYACVYRATGGQLPSTRTARGDVLSARERLEQYLDQVRQRLRTAVVARASAVVALTALVVTVLAVLVLR